MKYGHFMEESLSEASKIALGFFGNVEPTTKPEDNNQVLTQADIEIGEFLVQRVKESYPEHNIIDEEAGGVDNGSDMTWVIDPIEATSNFASGSVAYGIMIGLLQGGVPIAGGVILPSMGDIYLAEKGEGATKNGATIKATDQTDPSKLLFSFGIDSQVNHPERTILECRVLADLVLTMRNMRNSGCEALDPMYVAEGIYGARVNTTAKIWDNVGPQIIAEEAGAIWSDLKGDPIDYSDPLTKMDQNFPFCVAAPSVQKHVIETIDARI